MQSLLDFFNIADLQQFIVRLHKFIMKLSEFSPELLGPQLRRNEVESFVLHS